MDRKQNYTVEFFEMGLDDRNYEGVPDKPSVPMRTLRTIYNWLKRRHGETIVDFLKIDIEHTEWTVLAEILQSDMMDRVRQLAVEIHLMPDDTLREMRRKANVIRRLEKYGMVRFASLYNPLSYDKFTHFGVRGPTAFDVAFYNSKLVRNKPLE